MDTVLLSVDDAAQRLGITPAALRRVIFHNTDDLASTCVVRLGRRVRIRADRLQELIDEQTGAPPFQHSSEWREKVGRPAIKAG